MKTNPIARSLLIALAIASQLHAEPSTSAEGVTVETNGTSQDIAKETPAQRDARMAWWREAKFGLFIHWGVYAVPAGKYGDKTNYGEWIMRSAKIPVATYQEFASRFNPVKYDPDQWVTMAKDAGMKYIVITAKHHDGFALYPSEVSKWDIADATPYKKDLLGPLVSAAKREGLKIGFYYSQSQDWFNPGGAKRDFQDGEGWDDAHKGSYDAYLKNVAVPQTREIVTRYPIDILWWDTPIDMTPERARPFAELAKLRPGLIQNNRLGGEYYGDAGSPEQFVPVTGYQGDWETCMTLNNHWGYNAYDQNWKSTTDLIRKLASICALGGNFLLNVGPTAEGVIPPASVERLQEVGKWLRVNGEAIYGTSRSPFPYLSWGVATRKGSTLYLQVWDWPKDGRLQVPLNNKALSANLLASGKRLPVTSVDGKLVIQVPPTAPDAAVSVIALQIEGEPVTMPLPTAGAKVTVSAEMNDNKAENAIDGTSERRWRAPQEAKSAWLELELKEPTAIGGFGFDEPDVWPRMKQKFTLEAYVGDGWKKLHESSTVGHGEKGNITPVTARRFRLMLEYPEGSPGVAELQLYRAE